jgi:hypothetical protein
MPSECNLLVQLGYRESRSFSVLATIDQSKLPTVLRVVRTFVDGGGNASA